MMTPHLFHFITRSIIGVIMMTGIGFAAPYHEPDEAKELFKVEKIPLQVNSMKELAKHLIVIARREQEASPANQRATGQLLALAIRLDPANQDARETNSTLKKGLALEPSLETAVTTSKSRLRFFSRWLASPEAGVDANRLANYLADATKNLKAETTGNNDLGNWTGVVPPIDKYNAPGKKEDETPALNPSNINQNPRSHTPNNPQPTQPQSDFHIKELTLSSPFTLYTRKRYTDPENPRRRQFRTKHLQKISNVKLTLEPLKQRGQKQLVITSKQFQQQTKPLLNNLQTTLRQLLASRHSGLPAYRGKVDIPHGNYSATNKQALSGPLALMLESSISNQPLRQDIHICAETDAQGKLRQPDNFWQLLKALRQSNNGGRLIVTPASATLMVQVLVYDEADFFTRWEVLSAETLDEAMILAHQKSPENLAKASGMFKSIQNLAQKTNVTKLAVSNTIRSQLTNILKLAPNHASARILLIQGSGKRPMRLNKTALAHELLPVVNILDTAVTKQLNPNNLSSSELKKIHASARTTLDPLARLIDRSNKELYEDILSQTNDFRRLATIAKRLSGNNSNKHDEKNARSLFFKIQRHNKELLTRTLIAAGLPQPEEENKENEEN